MRATRHDRILNVTFIVVIVVVTALTYLPNLTQATIYRDDWYYTIDRLIGGNTTYQFMFSIDRPIRGYFFEIYYNLFNIEPLPYHLITFGFRLLTGLTAYGLFLTLWPKHWQASMMMSLLLLIYPGYTRWMEGFENQPHIVSLFALVFSIWLTLLAIRSKPGVEKVVLWILSIVSGVFYIFLVDFAIGMEVFRVLCITLFLSRNKVRGLFKNALDILQASFPALLIPGIFLCWRLLLFENVRTETDLNIQLGVVMQSPLLGMASWFINMIKSVINAIFLAWAPSILNDFFSFEKSQVAFGILLALASGGIVFFSFFLLSKTKVQDEDDSERNSADWKMQAILVGVIGLVAGVIPVVIANRSAVLGPFSHYILPTTPSCAMLVIGLLFLIDTPRARKSIFVSLVMLSVLIQFSASAKVLQEEKIINNFWHQVVWRAPGISEFTGLFVSYPDVYIGEDIDSVSGPANFLYYPQPQYQLPVIYKLQGMKNYPWSVNDFMTGEKMRLEYRSHYGIIDPERIIVITQPTPQSCVHIINKSLPWYSYNDPSNVVILGNFSNISQIQVDKQAPTPIPKIFGSEPEHKWCYYFQKAELAAQLNDWERVRALSDEVLQKQLHPVERLEWMPFLQAYVLLNDDEGYRDLISRMSETDYNRKQICNVLTRMQYQGASFSQQIEAEIANSGVCR